MRISAQEYRAALENQLTVDQRALLARKIGLNPTAPSADEQRMLHEILRLIAMDAEERVRAMLADALAGSTDAPRDVIEKLVNDTDLVAVPLLRLSEVLKPSDLLALIKSNISSEKMSAIAQRPRVPATVSQALAEVGGVTVAADLLNNHGADIPEQTFALILEKFGEQQPIQAGVVARPSLPPHIIGKAVSLISGVLLTRLVERHKLPAATSRRLVLDVHERAILGFSTGLESEGLMSLADQLIDDDALTPSLILRSLIVGNIEFVVHVIALECQLSPQYVRDRLDSADKAAGQKLWKAAGLPPAYLDLAFIVADLLRDGSNRTRTPAFCRFKIVERFFEQCPDVANKLDQRDRAFLEAARDESLADLSALE